MKTKTLVLSIMAVIGLSAIWAGQSLATSYYVRDGGGNSAQCTGTTNAVYPGSGSNKPCAFNHPRYVLGFNCTNGGFNCVNGGIMSSGDTLFINGDSDLNPGAQAQYEIGYDDSGNGLTPGCSPSYPYDCTMGNLPAGSSSSARTSIIGTGSHKPQLWGTQRVWQVLNADNNHLLLQNLEITDHSACAYNDPAAACNYSGPYPYGQWAEDGIYVGGDDVNLTDVYVHGLARYGLYTDNFGSANFTRVYSIGNGYGGVSTGINATISGTLTWNQPIVEWNGCVEAYPVSSVDNPANYSQCFGQNSGGYGDGVAFGNVGHGGAGNWTITGPGSISFNTQDGLDTLHGNGTGTIQIDKMRFEGNAGNQVKMNAVNSFLTNSVVIGDCGWWYGAPQSYSGFSSGDICRALGDAVLINVTNNSVARVYNNTIVSNGNIAMETEDLNATGCNSSTSIDVKNNIVLGGYAWIDDTTFNGSGGNAQTTYIYNDGNDGNGSGTCGNLVWNEDYNIVVGTKNNNQGCVGTHDKCGVTPGFASVIPMGAAGGAESTYYRGNTAATMVSLSSGSAAIASGVAGLNYWNSENDYHNVTRLNPPSRGGLEQSSCAVNTYGCLFNSDCCTGTCSNFVCGTASANPTPVVSITNPVAGSSFSSGSNVTITAMASESNGTITNVTLFDGSTLLGSSSTSPFSFVLNNITSGPHTFTAQATDLNGVTVTSNPISVTITAQSLLPSLPVIAITSPVSGSSLTAGSNLTVSMSASELNGTIANISLFNGAGVLLGSSNASAYSFVYSNLLPGTYTFTAQVTDILGVTISSSPVTVTVNSQPVDPAPVVTTPVVTTPVVAPSITLTSPLNGNSYTVPASITLSSSPVDSAAAISRVDYYAGAIYLGEATVSPYTVNWNSASAGNYAITAKATDSNGNTFVSGMANITVNAHTAPVVNITTPVNNTNSASGSNLTVTANATVGGGTITKVDFYNNSLYLGTVYSSPYAWNMYNLQPGTLNLTAKATDSYGWSTMSSAVAVNVGSVTLTPVVALTSPANGSNFQAGNNVSLSASASEAKGAIAKVEFYNGASLLGTATSAPYNFIWSNVAAGNYSITAKAYDNSNNTVTSSLAAIMVSGLPVVSMNANNSSYTSPATVTLNASASESNGTIAKVAFYNGTSLLGTSNSSPYSLTWNSVAQGSYNLTAVATDSLGVATTSSVVTITVNAPVITAAAPVNNAPSIVLTSPISNATYTIPTGIALTSSAIDNNATISRVDYYAGSVYLGEATKSPFTIVWNSAWVGTYSVSAKATDSKGTTFYSAPVTITVNPHSAPTVSLTSPVNNISLAAGSNLTVTANAVANGGSLTKVDFYADGWRYLGTVYGNPYTVAWYNVPSGTHSITAKATDSYGWSTTSTAVNVVIK